MRLERPGRSVTRATPVVIGRAVPLIRGALKGGIATGAHDMLLNPLEGQAEAGGDEDTHGPSLIAIHQARQVCRGRSPKDEGDDTVARANYPAPA